MNEPSKLHFAAAKRILRYLQDTRKLGITYVKEKENKLIEYTNSDWVGSVDDRKSTSGYVFYLETKIILYASKIQKSIALSSAEAEYIASTETACEAIWLRRILRDVEQQQEAPTKILCDNMSTIAMTKNPVFHARSKHIELRHHVIRNCVRNLDIYLEFINTNEQLVDGFIKAVSSEKIEQFCNQGCLGALDGTHIRVRVPVEDKPRYRTRKNEIATNVLGVCSQDMQFIYVLPGWEGSAADSRVLRDAISRRNGFVVPRGSYYLVDAGYTNGDGFLAPFRGQRYHLNDWSERHQPTTAEEFFNEACFCKKHYRKVIWLVKESMGNP
ncbi:UNVERIFIED_CONTAM: Retrovirus-related Pol polyprotein from transposon TNT 1-94 [Sesamum calycinum]|uniref:Retrovirus-related Pol polyprotein from transposon TNT 1-94 n=1 Tax=Sesamum calycinum TaxID=2727403 RepID=A0AAW2MMQ1_9LAMI